MGGGGKFDEIFVADLIFREQNQVIIDVAAAAAGLLVEPAPRSNVYLAADNRLDAPFASLLIEINRAVKHAVIGNRQGRELQLVGFVHEPVKPASAIEQRILGVQV